MRRAPARAHAGRRGALAEKTIAQAEHQTAERFWYHGNHLDSVSTLTDAAGQVVRRYSYDAYGDRTVVDGARNVMASGDLDVYGFTGRRFDGETGLGYFRARMNSAGLGRFDSRNSVGNERQSTVGDGCQDGFSLYGGCFIPNATDPEGHVLVQEGGERFMFGEDFLISVSSMRRFVKYECPWDVVVTIEDTKTRNVRLVCIC